MNKKAIFFTGSITFVIASYAFLSNSNQDIKAPINKILAAKKTELSKIKSEQEKPQERQTIATPPIQKDIKKAEPTNIDKLMFSSSQKAEDFLKASGKLRPDLEGEVYLEINSAQLLNLSQGDTFQLDIPELKILHDVKVQKAYRDQFGNKTIEAQLPNEDEMYGSVFTINERAIYANVSTPNGIYVMQGNGQYAWIAETNDLSKEAVMDPM